MNIILIALTLLTFCGVAGAEEDCSKYSKFFWQGQIAYETCRGANSLERIEAALERLAEK